MRQALDPRTFEYEPEHDAIVARAYTDVMGLLEPEERLMYSNGVRKAIYRDPDGNELGFGGAPLDTGS